MPKKKSSNYIGVRYDEEKLKWRAVRWIKADKKAAYNGYYKDEKTAAHASDTLARKLMENDKQILKLNFPDDNTEVRSARKKFSEYIGVYFNVNRKRWIVQRWNKTEKKTLQQRRSRR